jgi:hypothetical protein
MSRVRPRNHRAAALLLMGSMIGPGIASPARAEMLLACEIEETADGFVALRATPSPSGALIAKVKLGEIVEVRADKARKPKASGKWWRARHYPGETMPAPNEPEFKQVREGWIFSRYIAGCDQ